MLDQKRPSGRFCYVLAKVSRCVIINEHMPSKNLHTLRSKASTADKQWYTQGECHILAVALHRNLGWLLLVMCEADKPWWQDPKDPKVSTYAVAHVYALSPDGLAWDIRGAMPVERIDQDMRNYFRLTVAPTRHLCNKERDLGAHVHNMGKAYVHLTRPLLEYSEEDVELSWGVAKEVFAGVEEFESALPKKAPRKKRSLR